jgi:hypothetical protein
LAAVQASYLLGTGVWPLVHRRSFERMTGRKHDFWLVRTVGGLAAATGISLALAALHGEKNRETSALALASGLVFGIADLRAARGYSRMYLGDGLLQLAFAPTWIRSWIREEGERTMTTKDEHEPREAAEGRKGDAPEHTEPDRDPPTEDEDATDDYASSRKETADSA